MTSHGKPAIRLLMETASGTINALPGEYAPESGYVQHKHFHRHGTDSDHQTGMSADRRYRWTREEGQQPGHTHRHHHLPADRGVLEQDLDHHEPAKEGEEALK